MCGIAGIFHYGNDRKVEPGILTGMCNVLKHRGPDANGTYINETSDLGFSHTRLSIIDLASGDQPMFDHDNELCIIFNGEIYNFPELKEELKKKGYRFKTNSDTEVILNLYREYGAECFEKMNGIFSLAIYDIKRKNLILARDHFGVKPLYYLDLNGSFIFASEIKAILQFKEYNTEIDIDSLSSFLTFRYSPSPLTLFKGIRKLLPSHFITIEKNKEIGIKNYRHYKPVTDFSISEKGAVEKYQYLLENAVKKQMISDVPVGLFLSGGIDSAVIGYLMQKYSSYKIKSFSIGFEGKGDYNELKDARDSAGFLKTDHHEMVISQDDYFDYYLRSFYDVEEPVSETTIPALYHVAKLASGNLKVVLAGQGADEPLAGYPRYVGESYINKYSSLIRLLPKAAINNLLPRNERIKRALNVSSFKSDRERFLAIYTIFTQETKQKLFRKEFYRDSFYGDKAIVGNWYESSCSLPDPLSKLLYIDTRMSLSDDLLLFGDKVCMANSLEMRVPFLDVELVNFLETLPPEFKLKGRTGKYIHKKALTKWLPEKIINRKKRGFSTPMDEWLQNDLADKLKKLINREDSACRIYFNLNFINRMIDLHKSRKENYMRHLFILMSFEIWHRNFFETGGKPAPEGNISLL
jgi:asparagine synthase (glutamine-hydrolysing)